VCESDPKAVALAVGQFGGRAQDEASLGETARRKGVKSLGHGTRDRVNEWHVRKSHGIRIERPDLEPHFPQER
jgi:hypothetical protein